MTTQEANAELKSMFDVLSKQGIIYPNSKSIEAIDTVVAELENKRTQEGCICPACSSDKIYFTAAIHCNHCGVTTEI